MHLLEPGMPHKLDRGKPQQALDRMAGEQQRSVGGDEGDRVRAVLDQRAKSLLALAAGLSLVPGPLSDQVDPVGSTTS